MPSSKKVLTAAIIMTTLGCVVFFLYFRTSSTQLAVPCNVSHVQTGDIILSAGNSFKSFIVKSTGMGTGRTPDYSHIGIFHRVGDSIHIVHMSVDTGFIEQESLEEYITTNEVIYYDIYRMRKPIANTAVLASVIDSIVNVRIPFDHRYDMESEDSYYCTEFVYKSLGHAGIKDVELIKYEKHLYPNDFVRSGIITRLQTHD